jgi:malate synthase
MVLWLYNLMEDAATAEISRTQVLAMAAKRSQIDDGRAFTTHSIKNY